ncbi:hypothetical protein N2152v2_011079 [Parachlorella kessleri]
MAQDVSTDPTAAVDPNAAVDPTAAVDPSAQAITADVAPVNAAVAPQDTGEDSPDAEDNLPPLPPPALTACPTGATCPACYQATWTCSTGAPVDPVGNPKFTCPGGYFSRALVSVSCPCYYTPAVCVMTNPTKKVKAKNLDKLPPTSRKCQTPGYIVGNGCTGVGGGSDPIITGFDDRKFHFNEVGNFTLLSDGEGYMVETTFVGVPPVDGVMPKETSWTSEVRVYNARGDKVTCHLPAILPNTSRIESINPRQGSPRFQGESTSLEFSVHILTMTHGLLVAVYAQAAGSPKATPMTPYKDNIMEFEDMSATAVSSGWPNPYVTGCHVSMAKLDVIVYQVSGWSQATKYESEKWATPYTWLNMDVKLLKPLALPVTGILGATYPVTLQGEAALEADGDISKIIKANVATDPVAMRELEETSASAPGKARRLASAEIFPLQATVEFSN